MTTVKLISQLVAAGTLSGADLLPVSQGGVSKKATFAQILAASAAAGATGATGAAGPTGAASTVPGPAGATGLTGPSGATGATGSASTVPGPTGPAGATGATGPAGGGAVSSVVGQTGAITAAQIASGLTSADLFPRSIDAVLYCDQFASLQACHDALPSTGGKIIMPPNTTYVVTSTITISKPNVTIEGAGWGTVLKRGTATGQVIFLTGANATLRDCTIDGNGTVYPGTSGDIQAAGANALLWHIQAINGGGSIAVALSGANSRIAYSTVTGLSSATVGGYGIWAIGHVTVTIDHNTVSGTRIDGIGFDGAGSQVSNNNLFGNQCYATTNALSGGQLVAYPGYNGILISGNTLGQGGAAFSNGIESNANSVTISGNTINNQSTAALTIDPGAVGALISGNTIRNSGQVGGAAAALIVQAGGKNITLVGNRIIDDQGTPTTTIGMLVTTGLQDGLVIQGNDITGIASPLTDTSSGLNKVISGNLGIDNVVPSVASAYVTSFPINPVFNLTGTTGIGWAQVSPGPVWTGRQVTIIPAGVVTFTAGNNVANTFTTTAGVPFVGTYDGSLWHFGSTSTFNGPVTATNGATITGGASVAGGIKVPNLAATLATDLSKHIDLYGAQYGFSITAGRLNTVVATGNSIVHVVNGADVLATSGAGVAVTGTLSVSGGITGTLTGTATGLSSILAVGSGGTGVGSSTGAGSVVLSASPAFTGVPTAPTATVGTNTTQLATTAFVLANGGAYTLPTATSTVLGGVKPDNVTIANTAGVLTVAYGTATNTAAQGNDTRITGAEQSANKNAANGYAGLDGTGKVATAQLPASVLGALNYQGAWNATTNSPALVSATGTKGFYYTVSVAGATTLDGISQWNVGDHATYNGTAWEKFDGIASEVITVAGRTGNVVLVVADVSGAAPLASPTFTGTPTVPGYLTTATAGSTYAPLASPALTGTPTVPTATVGTNTTQAASTAFVLANTSSYTLPAATATVLGGVKPDGTTLANTAGAISVAYGTTAATAAQGNDTRITGALSATTGVTITSTVGAALVPVGTTAQQPDTGNAGEIRFNSTTGRFEHGIGGAWKNFVRLDGDTMTGALTASGFVGPLTGTASGNVSMTSSVGAAQLPVGTTAQQPDTGNVGELRYNTTTGRHEFGVGGAWKNHVRLDGDTMTGVLTATGFVGPLTGNASGTAANVTGTVAFANGGTASTSLVGARSALGISPRVSTATYGATLTIDWSLYDTVRVTLTGNIVITNTNAVDGQRCTIELTQDATGGRTVSFGTETLFGTQITSPLTLSAASKTDEIGLIYNSSSTKYRVAALVGGF